ncbi:hypothetical protein KY308_03465 [Candidatus Woesearchaeota archaeon]|nr:hypothetical protein [Candidatus Woesearchaeota archaeon]
MKQTIMVNGLPGEAAEELVIATFKLIKQKSGLCDLVSRSLGRDVLPLVHSFQERGAAPNSSLYVMNMVAPKEHDSELAKLKELHNDFVIVDASGLPIRNNAMVLSYFKHKIPSVITNLPHPDFDLTSEGHKMLQEFCKKYETPCVFGSKMQLETALEAIARARNLSPIPYNISCDGPTTK